GVVADAPRPLIGGWGGDAGPGDQSMHGVFGTRVGSSVLRDFINNGLSQANFKVESFQRPSGLVDGPPCQNNANVSPSTSASPSTSPSSGRNVGSEKELYLPGTECGAFAPPTPSPPPTLPPLHSL